MYNYKEIKENVATLAQRAGDPDYIAKIGVWVNLAQMLLFNIYDYYIELQDTHNFDTEDGIADYVMPNRFDKPLRVYDLTNNKRLGIDTEENYFDANIANVADAVEEAAPSTARLYGVTGITGSIGSSGTTVQVKSSSLLDTTSPVVRIEGYLDSAKLITGYEDITITAATPTTYKSGIVTFYGIPHISKSIDTTGYITVADSSDDVLALISPTERVLRHKIMKLGKIPSQTNSMRVLFKKRINKLVDNNDYPFIEADNYLILDAWGWALSQEKETIDKSITTWKKAEDTLKTILMNQNSKLGPDFQHKFTSIFAQSHRQ